MKKYLLSFVLGIFSLVSTLSAQSWSYKMVNLPSQFSSPDMIYVPANDRLYVAYGSKVYKINPYFARFEDSITFPDIVQKIVISDDARYLYAIIGGTKIMRYNLTTRQQERTISMGVSSFGDVLSAQEMVVMPKHPLTLVVFRSGNPVNVAVFDDNVRRPHTTENAFFVLDANSMVFAGSDTTTVFAVPNGSSSDAFFKLKIKPDGVYATQAGYSFANGFSKKLIWGTDGFLYGSSGVRIDVNAPKPRVDGIYRMSYNQTGDAVHSVPDPLSNEVYEVTTYEPFSPQIGSVQLTTFNKTTFNQTGRIQIPMDITSNSTYKLIDWGSGKLAFAKGSKIVILQRCASQVSFTPSIEQGLKLKTCADSAVVLSATQGAAYYFWSTGDTGRIVKIKQQYRGQSPMTISVSAADAAGCPTAFSTPTRIDFQDDTAPSVLVEESRTTICQNDSVKLTVNKYPNQQVEWTTGVTRDVLYAKQAGSYAARFVTSNGCKTVWSYPVVFTGLPFNAPPRPTVTKSTTDTNVCVNQTITLTATANYPRYQWTDGTTTQTLTWRPYDSGVRSFSVRVTDANGCVSPPSVPIVLNSFYAPQRPYISVNGNVLASTAAEGNQWFLNGSPIAGATSPYYTVTSAGKYTVQVKLNGCTSEISDFVQL